MASKGNPPRASPSKSTTMSTRRNINLIAAIAHAIAIELGPLASTTLTLRIQSIRNHDEMYDTLESLRGSYSAKSMIGSRASGRKNARKMHGVAAVISRFFN